MADQKARLLIVDDNKVNRLLLARSVEMLGHRASLAENGRVAMQMLQTGRYDVLLLDIEMPRMDGYAVAEHVRIDQHAEHAIEDAALAEAARSPSCYG